MQLHNDAKKPWSAMVTEEVGQMNTELVCPSIKKLSKLFTLCCSTDHEDGVYREAEKDVLLWQHVIEKDKDGRENKSCYGNILYTE